MATRSSSSDRSFAVLAVLGVLELVATAGAASVVGRETTYPLYLTLYFAMGIPWLVSCHYAVGGRVDDSRRSLGMVLFFALAMRLVFLFTDPLLSDDVFRYVWEGRVQHAGTNPYLYAPEAPELESLRDEQYEGINNKDIPTIYPPLMQMAFYVATSVSESLLWMKAFFVLTEVGLAVVLFALLESLGLGRVRALVYLWCPLTIVEVAGSGHNDVLAVLFMMGAQLAVLKRKEVVAMTLLSFSGLAKIVGFALAPLFARAVKPRAYWAVPILTLVFAAPYYTASATAFRGLTEYGMRWRGNDSLFHLLYALTGSLGAAKIIVAGTLVALVLIFLVRDVAPLRSSYLTMGAILLLTTTVHPWYLLWIVPFLCVYPSPAWLYLTLGIGLGYHAAYLAEPGQPWEDASWVKLVEYGPFFALGLFAIIRDRRAGRAFLGLD